MGGCGGGVVRLLFEGFRRKRRAKKEDERKELNALREQRKAEGRVCRV